MNNNFKNNKFATTLLFSSCHNIFFYTCEYYIIQILGVSNTDRFMYSIIMIIE